MVRLIVLFCLISNISYAQDSIYLDQGKLAPFSGYLSPEETIKRLRNDSLERDMYKTTNDLKDQQIGILAKQNNELSNTVKTTSSLNEWEKVGYFAAGVVATGLAIKLAHEIYK